MKRNPYLEDRDKKNSASGNLPVRLNILLGISLTLMIALIIQLAFLTIKQGAYYQGEVNRSDETIEKGNVPRGMQLEKLLLVTRHRLLLRLHVGRQ